MKFDVVRTQSSAQNLSEIELTDAELRSVCGGQALPPIPVALGTGDPISLAVNGLIADVTGLYGEEHGHKHVNIENEQTYFGS